ncbi:MAG: LPS assembly lipoprotein LptE [Rikenellaceae bacterium]
MKKILFILLSIAAFCFASCAFRVSYTLSGASIPVDAKTFSVAYFPNNATMVAPVLSSTLTDELKNIYLSRTSLTEVGAGGDFAFEGEITTYTSTTSSVSSGDYALMNRLTLGVKVRFTNVIDDTKSFNKSFSAYQDYPSTSLLTEVEDTLIPELVEEIVLDIFQASASDW